MEIIDLTPEHEELYFCCLEDWSEEMKEAGGHKQRWYEFMKNEGLRVKLAQNDSGEIGGMIQYVPIEHSMFEGRDLYVILCIWVHGYKEGRGKFQKQGMGRALLEAAEEDVRALGGNGLVTWGMVLPVFMRASWFKKHGYKVVARQGIMQLMWKKFDESAEPPRFLEPKKKPEKGDEKVNLTVFNTGWCPAMNIAHERTLRAAGEFRDKIEITELNTNNRELVKEWGITDAIFLDGKEIRTGPPPTFKKLRKKIEKRVRKI